MNQEWNVPGTTKEPYSTEKAWGVDVAKENSEVVYWRCVAKGLRNENLALKKELKECRKGKNE